MSRSKKNPAKKAAQQRGKTTASKLPATRIGTSDKKPAAPKQPKPNLQPARVIEKSEPEGAANQAVSQAVTSRPQENPVENTVENTVAEAQVTNDTTQIAQIKPHTNQKKKNTPPPLAEPAKPVSETSISSVGKPAAESSALSAHISRKPRRSIKRILVVVAVLLVLGAGGLYLHSRSTPDVSKENKQLLADVGKRAILPAGETPAISTVVDEARVNQPFLFGTRKGDKVLLYFQAGKAIVYRPSSRQIVNMGPLETPKARVFIRNGASGEGAAAVAGKLAASTDFVVASKDDSPKQSYNKSIVVDLSGVRPDVAKRLAEYLGAKVGSLPDGESRPDADLMVIVGSDQTTP